MPPKLPKAPQSTSAAPIPQHEIADHLDNHETHPNTLHQIALQQPGPDEYHKLAENPSTSEQTLAHMHADDANHPADDNDKTQSHDFKRQIVQHDNAPKALVHEAIGKIDHKDYNRTTEDTLMHPKADPKVRSEKVKAILNHNESGEGENWDSSYGKKSLAREYFNHKDTKPEDVGSFINHASPEIAAMAAQSQHASHEHHINYADRGDTTPDHIDELIGHSKTMSGKTLSHFHEKYKDAETSRYGGGIKGKITSHENTPRQTLEAIAAEKSDDNSSYHGSPRSLALSNPNFDHKKVSKLAAQNDTDAEQALMKRPETDESDLRLLDTKHGEVTKYGGSAKSIIAHPNYPEDLQMARVKKGSAEDARAVLSRDHVSEAVLKEAVNHKNKNVAIEALQHKSVTPGVVQHAFGRKMADVSRAASNHKLATPEMKMSKATSDPVAAAQMAKTSDDPEVLKVIHDQHGQNIEVNKALANNKYTPTDVVGKIADFHGSANNPAADRWGNKEQFKGLGRHPNLDATGRKKLVQSHLSDVSSHPDLSPEEMNQHLSHLSDEKMDNANSYASNIMDHPNLDEATAKDIVGGKYGKIRNSFNGNDGEMIHSNSQAYTKDVINHGLDVAGEHTSEGMARTLAQSPHLNADDIKQRLGRSRPGNGAGQDAQDKHDNIRSGLLSNENLPREEGQEVLHAEPDKFDSQDARAVLDNPSTHPDDVKKLYTSHGENLKGSSSIVAHTADAIKEHNLTDHALEHTTSSDLAHRLTKQGYSSDSADPEKLKIAMKNKTPGVASDLIRTYGRKMASNDHKGSQKFFDSLAEHSDPAVSKAAFPYMSEEGRSKIQGGASAYDPEVIKNMTSESVKGMKIHKDTSPEAMKAIVDRGVDHGHLEQAVEHSAEGAQHALHQLRNTKRPLPGFADKLETMALDHHPGNAGVVRQVAKNTKNPDVLKKILQHPDSANLGATYVAENPKVKSSDLDSLISTKVDPVRSPMFGQIANSPKASVKMLSHIAEHYPEHMDEVASNPKVASSSVLKRVVASGGVSSHIQLVNNPKVPQGIKDELMKRPAVMLGADPEAVSPEQLEPYANDSDLHTLAAVAKHPKATPEIIGQIVDTAMKHVSGADMGKAMRVLDHASNRDGLNLDTQEKLALHSPQLTMNLLTSHGENMSPKVMLKALDAHKGTESYNDLLGHVMDNKGLNNPEVIDHALSNIDFNKDYGNLPASTNVSRMLHDNDGANDKTWEKAFDKFKEARGADHVYPSEAKQEAGDKRAHADANLLNKMAMNGPESVQNQLIGHPELAESLVQNSKLSKTNYDRMLDTYMATPEEKQEMGRYRGTSKMAPFINSPRADSKSLDLILDHSYKVDDRMVQQELAHSQYLSPDSAKKLLGTGDEQTRRAVLKNRQLPAEDLKNHIVKSFELNPYSNEIEMGSESPNFKLDMLKDLKGIDPNSSMLHTIYHKVATNFTANPEDLQQVYDSPFSKNGTRISKALVKNPQTPDRLVEKMINDKAISKEDAFTNPAIGGKLWRGEKHEFPEVQGIEKGKENNEAVFRPREEKVKSIQSMIPKGGQLDWAEFKKANPSMAGDPIVQKLFSSAPKQKVDAAHADKYLKDMPAKKFHVSYSKWTGMQRHNDKPQAVFQINNGEDHDSAIKADKNINAIFRMVHDASYSSSHPTNPQNVGWSRVDTSNKDHWFVDELQSDFNSGLSKQLNDIQKKGRSDAMEKYGLSPEEGTSAVEKMNNGIQGWEKALLNNIIETAKAHGVKKVSVHSGKSKTITNKGHDAEVTNKYDKIYNRLPQEMGFKPAKYSEIPGANLSGPIKDQDIWSLDLSGKPEAEPDQVPAKEEVKKSLRRQLMDLKKGF